MKCCWNSFDVLVEGGVGFGFYLVELFFVVFCCVLCLVVIMFGWFCVWVFC